MPGLALALVANPRVLLHARRHLHQDLVLRLHACVSPWQVGQGSTISVPVPPHTEHVLATEKKPCWNLCCPRPPHCVQVTGCLPLAAPDPLAVRAGLAAANLDLALDSEDRLFKLQRQVVAQIAPALHPRSLAPRRRRPC